MFSGFRCNATSGGSLHSLTLQITKEKIIFHTLRSLQDAASNIYIAYKEAYAQGKTIIPGPDLKFILLRHVVHTILTVNGTSDGSSWA